jgi:hypothetical protein
MMHSGFKNSLEWQIGSVKSEAVAILTHGSFLTGQREQLAHATGDPNGRAYNRTAHLIERRKMMQTWADYLDGLKAGAKVIPF